jgi:hypothetical protein
MCKLSLIAYHQPKLCEIPIPEGCGMGQGDGQQGDDLKHKAEGWFKGIKDKVQHNDWVNKARDEVTHQGEKAANGVIDQYKNKDWRGLAQDAGKIVGQGGITGIIAGGILPGGGIAKIGVDAIGGVVAKRQADELLNDPSTLSQKMLDSFDSINGNKDKFINGTDLKDARGGIDGLLRSDRGVLPILDKGYSKFAALDGKDVDEGVSRKDLELFKTVQSQKSIDEAVSSDSWTGAKWGGIVGGAIGLGIGAIAMKGSLVSRVIPAIGLGLVGGGVGYGYEHHSSVNYYADKKDEAEKLVTWLKQEL